MQEISTLVHFDCYCDEDEKTTSLLVKQKRAIIIYRSYCSE